MSIVLNAMTTHQKKKKGFESLQTNSPAEKNRMQTNLRFLVTNLDESELIEAIQTLDYEGARLCDVNLGLTACAGQRLSLPGEPESTVEALVIGNVRIEIPREQTLGIPEINWNAPGQFTQTAGKPITGIVKKPQTLSLPGGDK